MKELNLYFVKQSLKLTKKILPRNFHTSIYFNNSQLISPDLLQIAGEDSFKRKSLKSRKKTVIEVNGEVLFGISPVKMALDANRRTFYHMFLQKSNTVNSRLLDLEIHAKTIGVPVTKFPKLALNKLAEDRPHQGVCLDVSQLSMEPLQRTEKLNDESQQLWVLLDKVQDPMNLGAVLRSSYYFGVDKILVTKSSCPLTPVVSKASSGAMELLPVYQISDATELLKSKVLDGWSVIGTASQDAADQSDKIKANLVDLKNVPWHKRTLLIIGSEGSGISEELVELCHKFLYISTRMNVHPFLQSLNVSVATGIILQHFSQQKTS